VSATSQVPEVGQAVRLRGRLGVVRAVAPYDTRDAHGRLHLVEVEYLDDRRFPETDHVLWEAEGSASLLGATSLPSVDQHRPDSPKALRAFVNAHRWTRLNRLREAEQIEEEPLLGVWNAAIQVHHYQLDPVVRALEMPRVSLLLADGVGLGKTIQAGLVLQELLLRRRIRRVLVICPAMLQRQWQYELRRKFNLDFQIVDSDSTFQLRRCMGIDTNPWKAFPRIITSMDYLRIPDVLHQFLQASGADPNVASSGIQSAHRATWDLLIVDECHHFAPQAGNRATQRTRMLRDIRFLFEHRIFLSATPHNGKTVCFTGLLELLDPVRFQMKVELDARDREHLEQIRVRRLKEEINRQSVQPLFAEELPPKELPVTLSEDEQRLYQALRHYRQEAAQSLAAHHSRAARWLGHFILALLTKRLLSCPFAFARTWWRHIEDQREVEEGTLFEMARVSAQQAEDETKSDQQRSQLEEDTARYGGTWLRRQQAGLVAAQQRVSRALESLGYSREAVEAETGIPLLGYRADSKTEALVEWVRQNMLDSQGRLRDDERLVVFTEYKETLAYLEKRLLLEEPFDENTLRLLYGGMTADEFEKVKQEFEDPESPVRLLLATDAASEGINMQECCRWVIHYDIPWSPSKLQQRNGRVSRHGQLRDVSIHYFRCDQDEDMEFLRMIARKVDQIREDLGSVEYVLSEAIQKHFQGERTSSEQLDVVIQRQRELSHEKDDLGASSGEAIQRCDAHARRLLENTDRRLGISPQALVELLRTAIQVEGRGALEPIADKPGFYRLDPPPRWHTLARETLTCGPHFDRAEIVFDAALVEEQHAGRRVLRLTKNQVLLRLGHPIMRRAMATLCRQLHDPASPDPIYRWSLASLHRANIDTLLVLYYTLTAINDLCEPLHDDVLAAVFDVEGERLSPVDREFQAEVLQSEFHPVASAARRDEWCQAIRARWPQHRRQLEAFLAAEQHEHQDTLRRRAADALQRQQATIRQIYEHRLKELQDRTRQKEFERLARELAQVRSGTQQLLLFEDLAMAAQQRQQELEEQIELLRRDAEQTRRMLLEERDHRLNVLLPKRFQIREVRVLPLALIYLIPAAREDLQP